jgi:hypothetical protein
MAARGPRCPPGHTSVQGPLRGENDAANLVPPGAIVRPHGKLLADDSRFYSSLGLYLLTHSRTTCCEVHRRRSVSRMLLISC